MKNVLTYQRTPYSKNTPFRFIRTLESSSEIYVKVGDEIRPETILYSIWKKSGFRTFDLSQLFNVSPEKASILLQRTIGSRIYQGDVLAKKKEMFGLKEKVFKSPLTGVLVDYSEETTRFTLQYLPQEIKKVSGVFGKVIEILPEKSIDIGTIVDTVYGLVSFGVDREGSLLEVGYPDIPIQIDQITDKAKGKIIFGGTKVSIDVLYKALSVGVRAVITGGIDFHDYLSLRGSKGRFEDVGFSVLATEGFTTAPIYTPVYDLLKQSEHRHVFLMAALQKLVIPLASGHLPAIKNDEYITPENESSRSYVVLAIGAKVRLLSGDYAGEYGIVSSVSKDDQVVGVTIGNSTVPVHGGQLEVINE